MFLCFPHNSASFCLRFGLWKDKNSTPTSKHLGYQLSDLLAHRLGTLFSGNNLTGLLCRPLTVANMGLDSSRLWEGLSQGSTLGFKIVFSYQRHSHVGLVYFLLTGDHWGHMTETTCPKYPQLIWSLNYQIFPLHWSLSSWCDYMSFVNTVMKEPSSRVGAALFFLWFRLKGSERSKDRTGD